MDFSESPAKSDFSCMGWIHCTLHIEGGGGGEKGDKVDEVVRVGRNNRQGS